MSRRCFHVHMAQHFTRGETQALVITTLGTEKDAQMIDSLNGKIDDTFYFSLHNFLHIH